MRLSDGTAGVDPAASDRYLETIDCTKDSAFLGPRARTVTRPALAIGILALLYIAALPRAFAYLMPQPDAVRIALSVGLIAPLAFAMGMPFPRGVARLAERAPALIPWAWGVNACASVVAAILATVLAIHIGFDAVVALAVAMYALAAVAGQKLLGGS